MIRLARNDVVWIKTKGIQEQLHSRFSWFTTHHHHHTVATTHHLTGLSRFVQFVDSYGVAAFEPLKSCFAFPPVVQGIVYQDLCL